MVLEAINRSLDNIERHLNRAYFETWRYIQVRIGYWKAKVYRSRTMREMMEAVVLYGGGRNAQIAGYRVGGKSGTSQKLDSADEKARSLSAPVCAEVLEQTLVYKGVPRAADTGSADAQAAALPADGDSFDGA